MTSKLLTLKQMLEQARTVQCGVGSFSPRYTPAIEPILHAGQKMNSPLIVQISQNELSWYNITAAEFAAEFYRQMEQVTVPVALHLDHTRDFTVIQAAIEAGFTSVMIDASDKPLDENIATTRRVADYAHAHNVSVEAELGRIGRADDENVETPEMYTNPDDAHRFVSETGVDALAVSVGTVHGVYRIREARIDFERLQAIRAATDVPLVLHGGSGLTPDVIQRAIRLPGGGVSKINIATDLEHAFLSALNRSQRMPNTECKALPREQLIPGLQAIESTVVAKITNFLQSKNCADQFNL